MSIYACGPRYKLSLKIMSVKLFGIVLIIFKHCPSPVFFTANLSSKLESQHLKVLHKIYKGYYVSLHGKLNEILIKVIENANKYYFILEE